LYYLYNLPGPQTGAVEWEPKFEAPVSAAPSKNFGLRHHHLRIWGSGSTALVVTRPDEREEEVSMLHSRCSKDSDKPVL